MTLPRPVPARLSAAGTVLVLAGAAAVAALHLALPDVSPIRFTISEYQLTGGAVVFNLAVLVIAAGAGLVLAALLRHAAGRRRAVGALLTALTVIGLVAVAAFTKQDWSQPPTVAASLHRVGSLLAFTALPAAVLTLRPRRPRGVAAAISAAVGLALFSPILIAIIVTPHSWWTAVPLGLTERGMALADFGALLLAGWPRPARPTGLPRP